MSVISADRPTRPFPLAGSPRNLHCLFKARVWSDEGRPAPSDVAASSWFRGVRHDSCLLVHDEGVAPAGGLVNEETAT